MIVGLGGVGSFAAEFIARSGIGKMTIIDGVRSILPIEIVNFPPWQPTFTAEQRAKSGVSPRGTHSGEPDAYRWPLG